MELLSLGATSLSYYAKLAGSYTCIESNSCGGAISNAIAINVNQLPTAIISTTGNTKYCLGNEIQQLPLIVGQFLRVHWLQLGKAQIRW